MALKLGSLFIEFGGETSKLKRAQKEVESINKQVAKSFTRLGAAAAAYISIRAVTETIKLAESMLLLDVRIRNVTKSEREFLKTQKELLRISNNIGVSLGDTVKLYESLKLASKEVGASNPQVLQLSESLQQLGVIGGSSVDEMNNSLRQFGQAMAGGVVRAEEFNSILENTPRIANAIADGLGVSLGQLRKMMLEGQLLSKDVFNALLSQTGKINEQFQKIPLTLDRANAILQNEIGQALKDINNEIGFSETIANGIKSAADIIKNDLKPVAFEVIDYFRRLEDIADAFSDDFAPAVSQAADGFRIMSKWARDILKTVGKWIDLIIESPLRLRALFASLFSQIDVLIANSEAGIRRMLLSFKEQINEIKKSVNEVSRGLIKFQTESLHHYTKEAALIEKNRRDRVQAAQDAAMVEAMESQKRIQAIRNEAAARATARQETAQKTQLITSGGVGAVSPTVQGATGFQADPVSEADKLRALFDDGTQAILNAHKERHNKIMELTKISEEERRQLLIDSQKLTDRQLIQLRRSHSDEMLGSIEQANSSILDVIKAAGKERTAVGKAALAAEIGLAISKAWVAIGQNMAEASKVGFPFNIPLIAGAVAQGAGIISTIQKARQGAGRQQGGIVSPGLKHQVAEGGQPEIFEENGKMFVVGGSKGGRVLPMRGASSSPNLNVVVNNTVSDQVSVSSEMISREEIMIQIKRAEDAAVSRVNTSLAQGRGDTSQALNQGFRVQRNIS